jgi:hypothetical protein
MKKEVLLILLLLFTLPMVAQKKIFVAANGNETNNGSIEKPVLTVSQALYLSKKSTSSKIEIILRKGVYYPEATIELKATDIKKKAIHITAYENEEVIISGANKVKLKWSNFNSSIFSAKVNLDFDPDAMFINGKAAIMARYPNYDSTARFFNGTAADAISAEKVQKWSNPSGGFFHALHAGEWGSFHYRITGKDDQGNLKKEGGWQNNRPSPLHPKLRFVENIFEELDSPGEWFYNKLEQTVYYYPLDKENLENAVVEFSRLKTIFYLKGNETSPIKNITISKIKFVGTKRVLMEKHEPLLRSDWMLHRAGAITIEGSSNCSIFNCEFSQLGGTAVMVTGYNRDTTIEQNHIRDIGGSGICFVGEVSAVRSPAYKYEQFLDYHKIDKTPGPQNNLYPKDCKVYNNLIHNIGTIEKQATGVEISMSESIIVKNNTIYNTPRAGINIGDGTWGGHTIAYNDVFNTVLETGDHGAFNSWGRDRFWNANRKYMDSITTVHPEVILLDAQTPTIINNNRFRCDHGWDIDLDDGSSNYHIYNNICLNGGIKLREGFYRTVENNIMINNSFHPHVWFAKSEDVFRRNIITRNYYPIVIPKWGKEVDFNFFPDAVSLDKAKKNGTDKNSLYGNPMFLNANEGDYSLNEKSTALQIGFKNIDAQNIGVLDTKLRLKALKVTIPKLELPEIALENKDSQTQWLDAIIRNVNSIGDRSAYGLASENGVVVVSTNDSSPFKSGLLTKDVIIGSEDTAINDIFGLMSLYQGIRWKGKMNLNIIRDQQPKKIVIQLK